MKYIVRDWIEAIVELLGFVIIAGCVIALLAIFPILLLFVAIGFGCWLIDLVR